MVEAQVMSKAKTNYYGLTTDTFDDGKFNFNLVPGYLAKTEPLYSYNWPYDFCSLVELGKIESSVKFGKERLVVIDEAAQIIADLGIQKMRLLTNNPSKYGGLQGYNLEIVERVPLIGGETLENTKYLQTKEERLGHLIGADTDTSVNATND